MQSLAELPYGTHTHDALWNSCSTASKPVKMIRFRPIEPGQTYIANSIAHEEVRGMRLIDVLKIGPLISGDHFSWHVIAFDITLACTLWALVYSR